MIWRLNDRCSRNNSSRSRYSFSDRISLNNRFLLSVFAVPRNCCLNCLARNLYLLKIHWKVQTYSNRLDQNLNAECLIPRQKWKSFVCCWICSIVIPLHKKVGNQNNYPVGLKRDLMHRRLYRNTLSWPLLLSEDPILWFSDLIRDFCPCSCGLLVFSGAVFMTIAVSVFTGNSGLFFFVREVL